jgi:hypothetical protein
MIEPSTLAVWTFGVILETNPAVQACRRMGLPANYLYVHDNAY